MKTITILTLNLTKPLNSNGTVALLNNGDVEKFKKKTLWGNAKETKWSLRKALYAIVIHPDNKAYVCFSQGDNWIQVNPKFPLRYKIDEVSEPEINLNPETK
jgi:hypothetical protein